MDALEEAYNSVEKDGKADIDEVAETIGKVEKTVRNYTKNHPEFEIENGFIVKKTEQKEE